MAHLSPEARAALIPQFNELISKSVDDQLEYFLCSFLRQLGDSWKQTVTLAAEFRKACTEAGENRMDLNNVKAAAFLQKHGATRTAIQRTQEIRDIDINANNRISFIEYLLLHHKAMILGNHYERLSLACPHDLTLGGAGITGVGEQLLSELLENAKVVDPEVKKALEEFTLAKKARYAQLKALQEKAAAGGVKGMAAQNELEQLNKVDLTPTNRVEMSLAAIKRKYARKSFEKLQTMKKTEEAALQQTRADGRNRLADRAAAFQN